MRSKGFNPAASRAHQRIPPTQWFPTLTAAALISPLPRGGARHWLTLEGSLTRALQLRCRERFHVDVLAEGFALPTLEEARTLGIPARQSAWIREVQLCGDGQPWVMARTIIPRYTLRGPGRRLRHLGRKPLGAYLFSHPEWQRGPFQTGLCYPGESANLPLIARRSRFYSGGAALLVGEYFLAAVL